MENDTVNTCDRISDSLLRRMSCGCSQSRSTRSEVTDGGCNQRCSHTWGLEGYPLAMVYVPLQSFVKVYDRDVALTRGTIFEELDLPFMGESVARGGNCRG